MAIKCRRGYGIFQQPRGGNLASDRVQRRLTAILAADVAGYSRLMGLDEAGTARTLHEHRSAVDPIVAHYGGRIVKTTGDGVLLEFPSIVAAVDCAVVIALSSSNRTPPSMHYSAWGRFAFQWPILDLRVAQFDQFLNLGPQGITQLFLCRLIFVFEGKFVEIGLVAVLLVCRPRYRDGNAVVFNLSRLICCSK